MHVRSGVAAGRHALSPSLSSGPSIGLSANNRPVDGFRDDEASATAAVNKDRDSNERERASDSSGSGMTSS
uniref:Uncharacterized protein n=1 Tax=Peronospora matthiolae TaxID=2874970 RepID=A0AAV1TWB3_9STRA